MIGSLEIMSPTRVGKVLSHSFTTDHPHDSEERIRLRVIGNCTTTIWRS